MRFKKKTGLGQNVKIRGRKKITVKYASWVRMMGGDEWPQPWRWDIKILCQYYVYSDVYLSTCTLFYSNFRKHYPQSDTD